MSSRAPSTRDVDPSADGLRAARQLVIESMRQWCVDERTANAALDIANELTSNAVQHGRPPISVAVELDAPTGAVTVVVTDGDPTPARPLPYRAGVSERGLGLRIVTQLATTWGQRPEGDGKSVWATVHAARGRPAPWER